MKPRNGAHGHLQSESEGGLDQTAEVIEGVILLVDDTEDVAPGSTQVEQCRSHRDVVGDLELVPGFQSDGHALILTPAGVVAGHSGGAADGEASLIALDEDVLEDPAVDPDLCPPILGLVQIPDALLDGFL